MKCLYIKYQNLTLFLIIGILTPGLTSWGPEPVLEYYDYAEYVEPFYNQSGNAVINFDNTLPTLVLHNLATNCETVSVKQLLEMMAAFNYYHNTSLHMECMDSVALAEYEPFASIFTNTEVQTENYCRRIQEHPIFN